MCPKIERRPPRMPAGWASPMDIEVDGGIDERNRPRSSCAQGANVFVAGSALFGKPDYAAAVAGLRAAAEGAL